MARAVIDKKVDSGAITGPVIVNALKAYGYDVPNHVAEAAIDSISDKLGEL